MFTENLDAEIQVGTILAMVNYLPYGKKDDRAIGYGKDDLSLGPDDPFSLDILNIKQHAKTNLPPWQKDKAAASIAFFIFMFERLIMQKDKVRVAVIPSSTKDNKEHGASAFCEKLATRLAIPFDRATLYRTKSIPKAATGGQRDEKLNESTLQVNTDISKDIILLVDDVTTSGASRQAAISKLQAAGAQAIFFLALGCTLSKERFAPDSMPTIIAQHWELFFDIMKSKYPSQSQEGNAKHNRELLYYKPQSEEEDDDEEEVSVAAQVAGARV